MNKQFDHSQHLSNTQNVWSNDGFCVWATQKFNHQNLSSNYLYEKYVTIYKISFIIIHYFNIISYHYFLSVGRARRYFITYWLLVVHIFCTFFSRVARFTCKISQKVYIGVHQSFSALTANSSAGTKIVRLDMAYIDSSANDWCTLYTMCTSVKCMKVYVLVTVHFSVLFLLFFVLFLVTDSRPESKFITIYWHLPHWPANFMLFVCFLPIV